MSQKTQIYVLAGTAIALAASTAFFGYKYYSLKNELAAWYKTAGEAANSLPNEIKDMLDKKLAA